MRVETSTKECQNQKDLNIRNKEFEDSILGRQICFLLVHCWRSDRSQIYWRHQKGIMQQMEYPPSIGSRQNIRF